MSLKLDQIPQPNQEDASEDKLANKEDKGWVDYDGERDEGKKTAIHRVFIITIYGIAIAFGIVFLIRVAHFVMPHCWRWLSDHDIQGIDKLIFSGALGGLVGRFIKDSTPTNGK